MLELGEEMLPMFGPYLDIPHLELSPRNAQLGLFKLIKHGKHRVAIEHQHICHVALTIISDRFRLRDPGASCSATVWGATRNECSDIRVWGIDCLAHVSNHPKIFHLLPLWYVRWECAVPRECMDFLGFIYDICLAQVNVISCWAGWTWFAAWWRHVQWLQPLDDVATYQPYKLRCYPHPIAKV